MVVYSGLYGGCGGVQRFMVVYSCVVYSGLYVFIVCAYVFFRFMVVLSGYSEVIVVFCCLYGFMVVYSG